MKNSRKFPWLWLIGSLALLIGVPAAYLGIAMPYANSVNEPDGMIAMGGFCLGIVLIPIGLLSLLTLAVWVTRQRQLEQETNLSLNFVDKE